MQSEGQDPRDIPILTEEIDGDDGATVQVNTRDTTSAIISGAIKLADSLLHQAVKDIEATLFERVLDRLRAELPELVSRILAEQSVREREEPAAEQ
jgi:Zn-dependent M32 family carboxypeptidase